MESNVQDEKKEVVSELVGFDFSKLKATLVDLTLRPGPAINEYVLGDRKKYLTPITYFLLIFGLSFFLDSVTGVGEYVLQNSFAPGKDFVKGIEQAEAVDGQQIISDKAQLADDLNARIKSFFMSKEGQLLLTVPATLLFQWLVFRSKRKSFLHNSYFALYAMGHYVLLLMPVYLIYLVSHDLFDYVNMPLGFIVAIGYCTYAGYGFYSTDIKGLLLRSILVFVCAALTAGVLGILTGIILGGQMMMTRAN